MNIQYCHKARPGFPQATKRLLQKLILNMDCVPSDGLGELGRLEAGKSPVNVTVVNKLSTVQCTVLFGQ